MSKLAVAVVVVLAAVTAAGCATQPSSSGPVSGPGDSREVSDFDVAFTRDIVLHHQQAVDIAALAADHAGSGDVRQIAEEIAADRTEDIAALTDQLSEWGYTATEPDDDGHDDPGHDQTHGDDGHGSEEGAPSEDRFNGMPGIVSSADLAELEAATGPEWDRMFLRHMMTHHQGAVAMAAVAQEQGEHSSVTEAAAEIVEEQTAEVDEMSELLASVER